jgi:hypothetical protein
MFFLLKALSLKLIFKSFNKKFLQGIMVLACNPSCRWRQEDWKFESSLGYVVATCLKNLKDFICRESSAYDTSIILNSKILKWELH